MILTCSHPKKSAKKSRQDPATPPADDATPQPGSDEEVVANAAAMTKVNMAEIKLDAWLALQIFQHTPGTYPKPPTNSLCFGIPESFGALGMPGVCSRGMLEFS